MYPKRVWLPAVGWRWYKIDTDTRVMFMCLAYRDKTKSCLGIEPKSRHVQCQLDAVVPHPDRYYVVKARCKCCANFLSRARTGRPIQRARLPLSVSQIGAAPDTCCVFVSSQVKRDERQNLLGSLLDGASAKSYLFLDP